MELIVCLVLFILTYWFAPTIGAALSTWQPSMNKNTVSVRVWQCRIISDICHSGTRVRSLMLWMLYLTRYRPWMTYRNRMNLMPMTISTPTHETEVNPWK